MAGKNDYTDRFKKKKQPSSGENDSSRKPETNVTTEDVNEQENERTNSEEMKEIKNQLSLVLKHLNEHDNETTKTVKKGTKRRSFDLPNNAVFRLKIEAALSSKYMNDILLEALEYWFEQNGKAPDHLLQVLGDSSDE